MNANRIPSVEHLLHSVPEDVEGGAAAMEGIRSRLVDEFEGREVYCVSVTTPQVEPVAAVLSLDEGKAALYQVLSPVTPSRELLHFSKAESCATPCLWNVPDPGSPSSLRAGAS